MIAAMLCFVSAASATLIMAWWPFLDPIPLHRVWWLLLPPLALVIALVYKTLKLPSLEGLAWQTIRLTVIIMFFMIVIAVALWGITEMVPARG
ncbi:MAG: hypothetical protein CMJ49_08225 [Planctomycetaceae bacterium]|nr:hypothetical protein [Planctomycetaceae bacterium]